MLAPTGHRDYQPGYHRLAWVLLATGLATAPRLHAADAAGNYGIWGLGQSSCHQFSKAVDDAQRREYKAYIAGYLTSFNRVTPGVHQATGTRTMLDNLAVLDGYCSANPMDSFDQALQHLIGTALDESRAKGGKSAWGRVPQTSPGP